MLDRAKLAKALARLSEELCVDTGPQSQQVYAAWQELCQDVTFAPRVLALTDAPWPVPWWNYQQLDRVIPINYHANGYTVVSTDGSQIYPDRHQGLSCFLINTGTVVLSYGSERCPVQLSSNPYVFSVAQVQEEYELSPEFVSGRRHELELQEGFNALKKVKSTLPANAFSFLAIDGSLIFWHLEEKNLKERFLQVYLLLLLRFCQEKLPIIGYISAPKSKELINLARLWLCNFDHQNKAAYEATNSLTDAALVRFFVPVRSRTILFKNRSAISQMYPADIHPYFFYLNTGVEIGRVELPEWIARDEALVNQIAEAVLDQCDKGHGYPVAIAEAHEQAVVKGPDRDLFYHLLKKITIEHNQHVVASVKSQRKLRMGV